MLTFFRSRRSAIQSTFTLVRYLRTSRPRYASLDKGDFKSTPGGSKVVSREAILAFGAKYECPRSRGEPNWLRKSEGGGRGNSPTHPFPLNPSFRPPVPISDRLRTSIYELWKGGGDNADLHALSNRYKLSIKRIEAIIRLKSLEIQWKEKKQLQTGFLVGMETLLGVNARQSASQEIVDPARDEVRRADRATDATPTETKQKSLNLTYFELVDEGDEPIVPANVDAHRQRLAASKAASKTKAVVHVVEPVPGRPKIKFVDVGLKFFDAKAAEHREKEKARAKRRKERERARKRKS